MKHYSGRIEVICGSMFSGKTEELIRRVRRAMIARQQIQVFKPRLDHRYGIEQVTSHNGQNVKATPITEPIDLLSHLDEATTVVAIDEIQFLPAEIVDIVIELAGRGIRIICAGLDMDFRGEAFGSMPALLCRAEDVTKLHAICTVCGDFASFTQRLVNGEPAHEDDPIILVGAQESYEARCREHHIVKPARASDQYPINHHTEVS